MVALRAVGATANRRLRDALLADAPPAPDVATCRRVTRPSRTADGPAGPESPLRGIPVSWPCWPPWSALAMFFASVTNPQLREPPGRWGSQSDGGIWSNRDSVDGRGRTIGIAGARRSTSRRSGRATSAWHARWPHSQRLLVPACSAPSWLLCRRLLRPTMGDGSTRTRRDLHGSHCSVTERAGFSASPERAALRI